MIKERKFEANGRSITVPLNCKGYVVIANIVHAENQDEFNVTFAVGNKAFGIYEAIEGDVFTLKSTKGVNWDVYRLTMEKYDRGYFKPFIDRYDVELTAMNRGLELMEAERMGEE